MVCLGYKAPDHIDPKFLDPKYAFEDIDVSKGGLDGNEPDAAAKITSLKKLLEKKRPNRQGYGDDQGATLFEQTELVDFLESADPYEFLTKYHKVSF